MDLNIQRSRILTAPLTVGLIMLTIGNFLGANGLTKVGVTGDGIKRNLGIN
jgi:hypothetical protein